MNKKIHIEAAALAVGPQSSASSSSGAGKWDCAKGTGPRFWIPDRVVKSAADSGGDVDQTDLSVPQFPSF